MKKQPTVKIEVTPAQLGMIVNEMAGVLESDLRNSHWKMSPEAVLKEWQSERATYLERHTSDVTAPDARRSKRFNDRIAALLERLLATEEVAHA